MYPDNPEVEPVTMRSVLYLIKQIIANWSDINASSKGAALAFYTMLSVAPLLVVSIGIAALAFGRQAVEGQVVWQIQNLVGRDGAEVIQSLLASASRPASGILATIIGTFMLLFGASGVLGELRDSLNTVWRVKPASGSGLMGMIRYRFFSFAMVLGIGFLLMVSLLLSALLAAAGKFFGGFLPFSEVVLHLANLLVSFVAFTAVFALLYKTVPDVRIEWEDVWIGAAVTALLFSIGKFLIGFYIGKASVGSAYGAAGSLVVFLVWVYYSAQIFLLGAEFTHVFAQHHGSHAQQRIEQPGEKEVEGLPHPKLA